MVVLARVLAVALLAAALAPFPARAENPRLSLKLENVGAAEAAAQLGKAAGVPVELSGGGSPDRASFEWSDVTLGRALRQLCEKYGLRPARRMNGYLLYPSPPPGPAPKRVGLVEKNGMRLYARALTLADRRTVNFLGEEANSDDSQLTLQLFCELGDGDNDSIAGIENVTARDDQGNVLVPDAGRSYYGGYGAGQFPDEWSGSLSLSLPHPKAKRLAVVEGDLMAYRSVKPLRVDVPLPLTEKSVRRQAGDWLIVVSQYQAVQKEPEEDDADLPNFGQQPQRLGPAMRVRLYYPNRSRVAWRGGWGWHPYLVGASGRTYLPVQSGGTGMGDGQLTLSDTQLVFPALGEPPAKLVWDLVERVDPVKLLSFRMTDIPLPTAPAFVPRAAPPAAVPEGSAPGEDRPFYEKGGGTLVTRVRIGERAAGEGTLQVGLAARSGRDWGPVRWTEVPVGPDGSARLEDVKPGTYRVLRTYRPKMPAPPTHVGRWAEGESVVTLAPGKETAVAPLRWVAGPEAKKGSGPARK